jgi:uncharacterized protein (DUF433 family)
MLCQEVLSRITQKNGTTAEEMLGEYPQLTEEDIRAAIAYRAEMSRERYVDFLTEAAG